MHNCGLNKTNSSQNQLKNEPKTNVTKFLKKITVAKEQLKRKAYLHRTHVQPTPIN